MKIDPAIKRIRDVRRRISKAHNHDPKRVVAYYMELQRRRRERIAEESLELEQREEAKQIDASSG